MGDHMFEIAGFQNHHAIYGINARRDARLMVSNSAAEVKRVIFMDVASGLEGEE